MSRLDIRTRGSRAYNLARARGSSPTEILARAWCGVERARSTEARAVLRVLIDRAEAEA